ncbi:MAG TPA: hypothetical protein VER14_05310 [Phototrophicaceae bacterium]|jgi:hypothetical protein|nr:hypothetical protein [Phototrophicaceae bacterium]
MRYNTGGLKQMIRKCIYEDNTNNKIKLFVKINSMLPKELRIHMPLFITNDYINKVLYKLEDTQPKQKISENILKK